MSESGTNSAYTDLHDRFMRLSHVGEALAILDWDAQTMMPEGASDVRAAHTATLRTIAHSMLTDGAMKGLLDSAENEDLDDWQRANLHEMRRDWIHSAALPTKLVEAHSRACSATEQVWRSARPASDFKAVRESLTELVRITREIAAIKSQALGVPLYDALLDQYEPGLQSTAIDALFADLAAFIPGFVAEVMRRQPANVIAPRGPFPIEQQRALGVEMMGKMGFDFHYGRLDVSRHPFSSGTPDDARITTRYDEADFMRSLMGVLHETGHALYEIGLPKDWRGQPVGRARSMGVHESQSLIMEMQACRSKGFVAFLAPIAAKTFERTGEAGWDGATLWNVMMRVQPSFIRVDADEVTYPAHVILRYRLEKALITGDLQVGDLPAAWNKGLEDLLGITPPDDRQGCLQDIHWYGGAFGYFPCYTLGAMTAAQLFDAARRTDSDVEPAIARGDFAPLRNWLRANVHGLASRYSTTELVTRATGRSLDAEVFKTHLRKRYLS
ncbi:MAG TPA: carboxypeptidase M32 [Magnetospirillaceae bacterium]|jgi:carboxypeptidase Taq